MPSSSVERERAAVCQRQTDRVPPGARRVPFAHLGATVGTEVDDAGTPARARAGTLVVIGTMAAIAVVSVTAVVAWARLADPPSEQATGVEDVPTALADGSAPPTLPEVVTSAVDLPVVGAQRLDVLPDHMLGACTDTIEVAWDGSPEAEYAFVTADGVVASLAGDGEVPGGFAVGPGGQQPTGLRVRCDLQLQDGDVINRGGGGFEEILPGSPPGGGFMSSSCCDENGLATASASLLVPDEAHWALQERGSWYQAYAVDGLTHVGVSWRYRERRMGPGGPPVSTILFLAADGTIISEDSVGGHF